MRAASLAVAPLVILLLCAAEDQLQQARTRLGEMSPEQRNRVAETLKSFDLRLSPQEQASLRDLDQRISALPAEERVRYLDVLRRYHNWLDSLPETVKDGLLAKPPEERMAQIRILAAKYPIPARNTPFWIQFSDLGGPSAFELASLFKIWQKLTPQQRKEIETIPVNERTQRLHVIGRREHQIIREVRPADFDPLIWVTKAEEKLAELRLAGPDLKVAVAKAEARAENGANRKVQAKEQIRPVVLHRFAVNLYGIERPPMTVNPENLSRFLAELPPWVRSTFDTYPHDEARRKLTVAYRVVFPHPSEFKPGPPAGAGLASQREGGSPAPPAPGPSPPPLPAPGQGSQKQGAPSRPSSRSSTPF
jgi:hypothetical protein